MIPLKTNYEIGTIPHSEHPCPQAMRKNWLCLNGEWDFYKLDENENRSFEGKIIVPFSPETINSGVAAGFVLEENEKLVYIRSLEVEKDWLDGVVRLHFGAVDSECVVFINGEKVGSHKGGFTAFFMDIQDLLNVGENELKVVCMDKAMSYGGARGKQLKKRGGIWYTPQSGIWQTVWLEFMPKAYIETPKILTNALQKTVRIVGEKDEEREIVVFDGDKEILRKTYRKEIEISYDFELWSPENPKLYNFTITNAAGDKLASYFGVRSFGKMRDKKGKMRLMLNGKPYFFNGVLDQGYWSDGMLTYPSDKAAIDEIEMIKAMGFNTLRKHIKIEPMRWYYHCDRLGLVVWQDFVNGGGDYKFTHIAAFPFLGIKHRDNDYAYFARENGAGRAEFARMVDETLAQLGNCTCIGVWVPFNEGWGQFDSAFWTEYVRGKDDSRIIDSVSGWHDQGVGKTELKSLHTYYTPLKVPKDSRAVVLSEFGGYSRKIDGHVFDAEKEFGYKKFKTDEDLLEALKKLYLKKLKPLIAKGLCGAIYTQVSDVEEEINGLVTYDRKIVKVPVEEMAKINAEISAEAEKVALA